MPVPTSEENRWDAITARVREARTPRFDAVGKALTAAQTLGAVPLLLDRRRRTSHAWRQDQSYQWARERWNGAFLNGEAPPKAPLIVWVCKGIAETRLALNLSQQLEAKTGRTLHHHFALLDFPSVQNANLLPSHSSASAFPFDYGPCISRWLKTVRPQLVVAVEQIWHLHLARACRCIGVPLVSLHVQTRNGWDGASAWEKWLKQCTLDGFCALGFRNQQQADFWAKFLPSTCAVSVTGTLKFPLSLPQLDTSRQQQLEAWLGQVGNRPLVAAGSLETKEESTLFEAFAELRTHVPKASLLVAPRHLERIEGIKNTAQSRGWNCSRRSQWENGSKQGAADVLLLDTMGELALAYRACRAAFVGGSFAGNGHNVFEPLASGVPVVYGPKRGIFGLEQESCEASEVGWRVNDATELANVWRRAIEDNGWYRAFEARLPDFSEQARAGWTQNLAFLEACVRGITP